MPSSFRPILAILPVSLIAPGLWLVVQSTHVSNSYALTNSFADRFIEPMLLYGVLPALMLWLGSLPLTVATGLIWQRISGWAIPECLVAGLLSWALVVYAADVILPIPAGCFFDCPPGPGKVLPTSFKIAAVLSMFSLGVWIHIAILHLLEAKRKMPRPPRPNVLENDIPAKG